MNKSKSEFARFPKLSGMPSYFNMNISEFAPKSVFTLCTILTAFVTLFFVGFVFYTAYPTFESQGLVNFITGDRWSYDDHVFGIRMYLGGTLMLTLVTLVLSVPVGLLTAIFLSEFASARVAATLRPLIELLVGIPSVVYGIFGLFVLAPIFASHVAPFTVSVLGFIPFFSSTGDPRGVGLALASTVLAIMILPTIISVSEDSIRSVGFEYREASFSLGATHWETISRVVLPAASKGIIAAVILGMMRAMGETMAIVMLFGGAQEIPTMLFDPGMAMTNKILADVGFKIHLEEARSAIFAVAAVLFAAEILFVGLARAIGGRK
jgi:phosphate transport system permease protein